MDIQDVTAPKDDPKPNAHGVCPHCGYCPHCGRSTRPWVPVPYYPQPYPWNPWYSWYGTYTITNGNVAPLNGSVGVAPLTVGTGVAPLTVGPTSGTATWEIKW